MPAGSVSEKPGLVLLDRERLRKFTNCGIFESLDFDHHELVIRNVVFALWMFACAAWAHQIDEMTMHLEAEDGHFVAIVEADAAYLLPEYRGDADIAAQDLAWLRTRGEAEWLRIRKEAEPYLRTCLVFDNDSTPVTWTLSFPDFESSPPSFMEIGEAEMPPMIQLKLEGAFTGENLSISWKEPFGVVLIVQVGDEVIPVISGYKEVVMKQQAGEEAAAATPSFLGWIHLGFRHIIPEGLDHVLFILGIFLLCPKWKPLLTQSLIFTLAHSLTLGLAVMGWIQLPEKAVEIAIAASIVWISIENLWVKDAGRGRYILIGIFGLIHGLGFARMLTPLIPSNRPDTLLFAIGGFNIGVELGQILVLALAFALFAWWKKDHFAKLRTVGSVAIALTGIAMIVNRI